MPRWTALCALVIVLMGTGWRTAAAKTPTVIAVTTTADELNANGQCSLREATVAVMWNVAVDTCPAGGAETVIMLPAGEFALTRVEPQPNDSDVMYGDLDIKGNVTVQGAGQTATVIDGISLSRIFEIPHGNIVMRDLTLRNGVVHGIGGAIKAHTTSLTIERAVLEHNQALYDKDGGPVIGGAIALYSGKLTITASALRHNYAQSEYNWLAAAGSAIFTGPQTELIAHKLEVVGDLEPLTGEVFIGGKTTITNSHFERMGRFGIIVDDIGEAVIIRDSVFRENTAPAILNLGSGSLIERSEFTLGRIVPEIARCQSGGAISNTGTLMLRQSSVYANEAHYGGGVYNTGDMLIFQSAIISNTTRTGMPSNDICVGKGGGISSVQGHLEVLNSTIAYNHAEGEAGGIALHQTTATIHNSTIVSNSNALTPPIPIPVLDQPGLAISTEGVVKPVTVTNSLLAYNHSPNTASSDCAGGLHSAGGNLIFAPGATCVITGNPKNRQGVAPRLAPLGHYGSPTATLPPRAGSPLIDGGLNSHCPAIDQRGGERPLDGDGRGGVGCDIGAVELRPRLEMSR